MTCEELRCYFEGHLLDAEAPLNRAEVTEHVSTCVDCSQYVEEQRALGRNIRLVRESVPTVPESLDAIVVSRYRQYIGQRQASSAERGRRFFPFVAWAWCATAAALLVGAAFWFFVPAHRDLSTQASNSRPTGSVTVAPAAPRTPAVPATNIAKHRATATSKTYHPRTVDRTSEGQVLAARSLPEGFRSLMYCDALSCPSDMEMIRVQLPASAVSRHVPGFVQTSGSVTADVLVGPDGIARGIRFDEIEF